MNMIRKNISTVVVRRKELKHSAKGSTWKDHKYIKKVGDKYIYANDPNADTAESGSGSNSETDESKTESAKTDGSGGEETNTPEEFDLEEMAQKVIRGEFGNGADRKELLGESYKEIQNRVNEILLGEDWVKKQTSKNQSSKKTTVVNKNKTQTDEGPIKKETK